MCLSVILSPQLLSVPGGVFVSSDRWEACRAWSRGTRRKAGAAGECAQPGVLPYRGLGSPHLSFPL